MDRYSQKRGFASTDNDDISRGPKRQRTNSTPFGSHHSHGFSAIPGVATAADLYVPSFSATANLYPPSSSATAYRDVPEFDGDSSDTEENRVRNNHNNAQVGGYHGHSLCTTSTAATTSGTPITAQPRQAHQPQAAVSASARSFTAYRDVPAFDDGLSDTSKNLAATRVYNSNVGVNHEHERALVVREEELRRREADVTMRLAEVAREQEDLAQAHSNVVQWVQGVMSMQAELKQQIEDITARQVLLYEGEASLKRGLDDLRRAELEARRREVEMVEFVRNVECRRDAVIAREVEVEKEAKLIQETRLVREAEHNQRAELEMEVKELKMEVEKLKREVVLIREAEHTHKDAAFEPAPEPAQALQQHHHRHLSMSPSTLSSLSQYDAYHDKTPTPSPPPASSRTSCKQLPPSQLPRSRIHKRKSEPRAPLRAQTSARVSKTAMAATKPTRAVTGTTRSGRVFGARRLSQRQAGAVTTLYELDSRGNMCKL